MSRESSKRDTADAPTDGATRRTGSGTVIRIIAVGRMKDRRLADLVADFTRRIGRLAPFSVEEVKDAGPDKEAAAMLAKLGSAAGSERVICLDEKGRELDSQGLADLLGGHGSVAFLIGGPDGHGEAVRARADRTVRLSAMTFTHEMARLILVEQVYRGLSILRGMPYHRR